MTTNSRPVVIVIGAGFGGPYAAKQLVKADVDILLIDRQYFHLFTPLLYQVATSGLEPGEIVYPVCGIVQGMDNVRFLMSLRNRINVCINWIWNYLTYDRSARLILEHSGLEQEAPETGVPATPTIKSPEQKSELVREL